MAFITADFVKESSTVTGTGAITLAGARSPAQTFSSVCANGDTLHYAISHDTLNQWEVGIGTYNAGPNTITRTTTLASSNGGAAVNFSAGTKKVDLVLPAARIRNFVGPVQIGATSFGSGSLSFSNANGVSFSLSTNSNGGTVHASVATGLTTNNAFQVFSLSDIDNSVRSRITSNFTAISVSATQLRLPMITGDSTSLSSGNVLFALSSNSLVAAAYFAIQGSGGAFDVQNISLAASNGMTFLLDSTTQIGFAGPMARIAASYRAIRTVNMVSMAGSQSNSISNATDSTASLGGSIAFLHNPVGNSLVFSNANVRFAMSSESIMAIAFMSLFGGTQGHANQNLSFSNANGVLFGLNSSTVAGFGRVAFLTASVNPEIGVVSHVGGNVVSSVTRLAFENASNVTFDLSTAASAATVRASVAAGGGGGITAFALSNAASSVMATGLTFSNANGFSFLLSTGASAATLSGSFSTHALAVSAAGASASNGTVVWSNSNNVSFGQAGSTITASATVAATRDIGIVSHIGGNVVSSVSQLAFSNASNVTWSLSTAAGAATVIGSVAAGGGGGVTLSGIRPFFGELVANTRWGGNNTTGTVHVAPLELQQDVQFDRVIHALSITGSSNSTGSHSISMSVGIYTRNVATLSLITQATTSFAFTLSGTANASLVGGVRLVSIPLTTTLAPGNYWLALGTRHSTSGFSGSVFNCMLSSSVPPNSGLGFINVATNASVQIQLGRGGFSGTTSTLPSSMSFAALVGSLSIHQRDPYLYFASGTV